MSKKTEATDDVVEKEETVTAAPVSNGIEVGDPQILRPKELPLVVTPTSGKWENDAQAEYAATLNAYAYKNPEKWAIKKDVLVAQLTEIGKNPKTIEKFRGIRGNVSFKNQLIEK